MYAIQVEEDPGCQKAHVHPVRTRKEDLLHSKSDRVPTNANSSNVGNIFQDSTGAVYKGKG